MAPLRLTAPFYYRVVVCEYLYLCCTLLTYTLFKWPKNTTWCNRRRTSFVEGKGGKRETRFAVIHFKRQHIPSLMMHTFLARILDTRQHLSLLVGLYLAYTLYYSER